MVLLCHKYHSLVSDICACYKLNKEQNSWVATHLRNSVKEAT